ncbi:hypothetical protein ACVIGB_000417 [Bradyrhizobium sp. USDA 4341]
MSELNRPAPSPRTSPDFDGMIPGEDNRTESDLEQMTDAISDRLEYALPRTGLTPQLKLMMARLRHARDVGPTPFQRPGDQLLRFLAAGAPLAVHVPQRPIPVPVPPMPRFR